MPDNRFLLFDFTFDPDRIDVQAQVELLCLFRPTER